MSKRTSVLRAPFTYFGGKSRVASHVWERFGNVPNYVEPFAGSLAVLLARPYKGNYETVNDIDGFIVNFWRAVQADPDQVTKHATYPPFESDVHARAKHLAPMRANLTEKLESDPYYYDAHVAGWWVWLQALLIAGGKRLPTPMPRSIPSYSGRQGVLAASRDVPTIMRKLSERLEKVRVACGDWTRVLTPAITLTQASPTAIFLDPPYGATDACTNVYANNDTSVAAQVREWCLKNGDNPNFRIALCGYQGEGHNQLEQHGWTAHRWKANGGYSKQSNANSMRETIWFSPHCLPPAEQTLFN